MNILDEGKLSIEQLKELVFEYTKNFREEVLTHPYIGQDCAVIDSKGSMISISSDPITAAKEDIGRLAVDINLNDIAASGASPFAITVTILCPLGTTDEDIKLVMKDIYESARAKEVQIIGGHTEVTSAVNKMIISVTALGLLSKAHFENVPVFQAGDYIYVTKDIAMEGTHIIALEKSSELSQLLSEEDNKTLEDYSRNLSVVEDSKLARDYECIMHDITEGGILGAVWETCEMIGFGAKLDYSSMPLSETSKKICHFYNINPLRLISSGSMLIVAKAHSSKALEQAFALSNIRLSKIGELSKDEAVVIFEDGIYSSVLPPKSDELYKVV